MQFRTVPGVGLPLIAEEKFPLTPPAAEPVEDETSGDLYDADESDCAAEGHLPIELRDCPVVYDNRRLTLEVQDLRREIDALRRQREAA